MQRLVLRRTIAVSLAAFLILPLAFEECRAEGCHSIVMVYTLYNPGSAPARGVSLYCLVPQNIANQKILKIVHNPSPQKIDTDKWGQKIAVHLLSAIPPKSCANVKMIVWAVWDDKRVEIAPEKVGARKDIPEEIRQLYLCNRTKYQITSPEIQKIVKERTTPDQNMYEAARSLHRFVAERVQYDMDGEWDDAVTVLKRGTGSCSEFTFAYVALCRAAGIPARQVGGTKHGGAKSGVDLWNHRWPEVYLPNFGWVPADRDMFGIWRKNALILACGDGGEDTPIGWDYKFGWRAEEGYVQTQFRAYWNKSLGPEADDNIISDAAGIRSNSPEKELAAIEKLGASKKGLVVPFLADALYSREAKNVEAAIAALKKIGGRPVEVALVDALGKSGCGETDSAIISALREIAGENLANIAEWSSWLYSKKAYMGIRIRAFIDGRSKLVLTESQAQWFHYSGMPPGLGDGRNEPTFLEGYIWKPRWPKREKTYGGEIRSVPLRLKWPYPGTDVVASLGPRKVCGEARLLESAAGEFAILFQNATGKPEWFDVVLHFEEK